MTASYDAAAVAALADQQVSWQDKALPPAFWGRTVAEVLADKPRLSNLPTPLLTLSAPGLQHNVATLARWCAEHGVDLAPHGKTTMAPALWASQLDGRCLGDHPGERLPARRRPGLRREPGDDRQLRHLAACNCAGSRTSSRPTRPSRCSSGPTPSARSSCWRRLAPRTSDPGARRLDVLVEVGGEGGRTGARDTATAHAVGEAIAQSPTLRLAGVAGYEGAIAHGADEAGLEHVRAYLRALAAVHAGFEDVYDADVIPVVSAGGSAYFEQVAQVLGPLGRDRCPGGPPVRRVHRPRRRLLPRGLPARRRRPGPTATA